ncbi:MAG: hypothetical protein K6E37_08090 [Bacteroidales bacterium]|nr:hypothetical protein [Bacteroidales bacterium]
MYNRKFDTCFFEQYAQISLSALLGREGASFLEHGYAARLARYRVSQDQRRQFYMEAIRRQSSR